MEDGGEPPDGDRPRWSFTWLLRIQRVARRTDDERRVGRAVLVAVLAAIILGEVIFGIWLGILPR